MMSWGGVKYCPKLHEVIYWWPIKPWWKTEKRKKWINAKTTRATTHLRKQLAILLPRPHQRSFLQRRPPCYLRNTSQLDKKPMENCSYSSDGQFQRPPICKLSKSWTVLKSSSNNINKWKTIQLFCFWHHTNWLLKLTPGLQIHTLNWMINKFVKFLWNNNSTIKQLFTLQLYS